MWAPSASPAHSPLHVSPYNAGAGQLTRWAEWDISSPLDTAENGTLEQAVLAWGRASLVKWVWGLSCFS